MREEKGSAATRRESIAATVLVDYSNIRASHRENSRDDCELNLVDLLDRIINAIQADLPGATEVVFRLYGGWIDERGNYTATANHLLSLMSSFRRIYKGIRVNIEMILAPSCVPMQRLLGLLRVNVFPKRQKMVDALISVDSILMCIENEARIVIASDDDDMVPAVIAVRHLSGKDVFLYRHRNNGAALNDSLLSSHGTVIRKV